MIPPDGRCLAYCFLEASDPTWYTVERNTAGYAVHRERLKQDEARGRDFVERVCEVLYADDTVSDAYKEGMAAALLQGDYSEREALPDYCSVAGFGAVVSTEYAPNIAHECKTAPEQKVGVHILNMFKQAHWSIKDRWPALCRRSFECQVWQCSACLSVLRQDEGGEDGPLICSCGGMTHSVPDSAWLAAQEPVQFA